MQLNSPVRKRRALPLTPLIDVVFLLLIFFMLATTFLKYGTVKIDAAGAGGSAADMSKLVIIHVASGGAFRVNGAAASQAELAVRLDQMIREGRTDAVVVMQKTSTVADLVEGLTIIRRHRFSSVRVVN